MNINDLTESKFLKKDDCDPAVLVTINGVKQFDVSKDTEPQQLKWCLLFAEDLKPLVLNVTNANLIAAILGSEETNDWVGNRIVLFNDPSVSYAGKITGGIRVRAPRVKTAIAPAPAPAEEIQVAETADDSDLPF